MENKNNWHKPTEQEKLDEAHEYFDLPKKKRKYFDFWDKLKVALYEDKSKADCEVIEPKELPNSTTFKIINNDRDKKIPKRRRF